VGDIDGLRERVEAARRDYAELAMEGWGEPGPVDEGTGERWDRGNVLGHVAEMLPFWTGQIHAVLDGTQGEMGRDPVGTAQRRMGIDSGREAGAEGLLARIDAGMAGLLALLAGLTDADLARRVTHRSSEGQHEVELRFELEQVLIGHLEEHLGQLRAIEG